MHQQTAHFADDPWLIEFAGCRYEIKRDTGREEEVRRATGIPHAPCWYVQRMTDLAESKRYYSRPAGAFLALSEGAIKWE